MLRIGARSTHGAGPRSLSPAHPAIANDSEYGLGGAVWSQSLSTAMPVVQGVHTGTIWVTCYSCIDPLVGCQEQHAPGRAAFLLKGPSRYP